MWIFSGQSKIFIATSMAAAHRLEHWSRAAGCSFSQVCVECHSNDTQQAALRRQQAAAGALARGGHHRAPSG